MVRTVTTLTWILDIVPELLADERVQILFTFDNEAGSAYHEGAVEALHELGGRVVPWQQAVAIPFSLAIAASPNGRLEQLQAPLLILPHGPGYSKRRSLPADGAPPLSRGVTSSGWQTMLALSHEEGRAQWQDDPGPVRAAVVGDPRRDRLEASMRDRARYRRALGVAPHQRLVVTTSTWGPHASLARCPSLPARLLAELPADDYAVATILHPNVWVGHGSWQVRLWLRRAVEAGLRLMPPHGGWDAALVAGDLLIGDHGSVVLYGAALGLPVLLSSFGSAEILPGTPLAALGSRAPSLDHDSPLLPQLERVGFDRDPDRYADVTRRVFAEEGHALTRLRAIIYEAVDLDPPALPPRVLPVPLPAVESRHVTAHVVRATSSDDPALRVSVERHPAAVSKTQIGELPDAHLAVDVTEEDHRLLELAAVVIRSEATEEQPAGRGHEAVDWLAAALHTYPGARVAACALDDARCAVQVRDAPPAEATIASGRADPGLIGSATYGAWLDGRCDGSSALVFEIMAGAAGVLRVRMGRTALLGS